MGSTMKTKSKNPMRTKRVNARKMWTCGKDNVTTPLSHARYYGGFYPVEPVLVIPFDAASREALVERAAETCGPKCARAVLATLHPDFAKEAK